MFTAYKYSIHKNPRKSRIKIELSKTFTQFSPVYHKTITKGCYNISTVKETGQDPKADPQRAERIKTMKNLYLVETNASTMIVLHDTEDKAATVLDTVETNTPGFNLAAVEDVSAGEIFEDVEDVIDWLGASWNNSEAPKVIDMIWNWE